MFNVDDRVVVNDTTIKSSGAKGTVLDVCDNIVYVELDNGTEMDYPAKSLMLESDFVAELEKRRNEAMEAHQAELDNTPSHLRLGEYVPHPGDKKTAQDVIQMLNKIMPDVFDVAKKHQDDFEALDDFNKVKTLSELTGTPMTVWMGAIRLGGENVLRAVVAKTILNNAAQNTDLVGDLLLVKCQKTLSETE